MMQHIFIVNANANNGKILKRIIEIKDICEQLGDNYQLFVTESLEETKDVSDFFKNKKAILYAVGGDGTINSILNSIMNCEAYLGVLPLGSGNDFYRTLQEYPNVVTDCNVMKINDMYCLNIFSAGVDAEICVKANDIKKLPVPKSQIYNLGMAIAYFEHRNKPVLIKADGNNYYIPEMTMVTVCNGKYYGGGYKIAPGANLETSDADVYMVSELGKISILKFLYSIIKGTHEQNINVNKIKASQLEIITDEPIVANADGEIMYSDNYKITTNAGRIKVVKNNEILKLMRKK